jgi:LmbE family N-acetylglucosaminyl deacetylase
MMGGKQMEAFQSLRILTFSPHPDDEVLQNGGTIIRIRDDIVPTSITNVAVTLGSDPQMWDIRQNELGKACRSLGIGCIVRDSSIGFEPINVREVLDHSTKRKQYVSAIVRLLAQQKPHVVFVPHRKDRHPTHEATHELVVEALEEYTGRDNTKAIEVWFTQVWRDIYEPNTAVGYDRNVMMEKLVAIRKHRSQVERNYFDDFAKFDGIAKAILGPEIIGEFGDETNDIPFAEWFDRWVYSHGNGERLSEEISVSDKETLSPYIFTTSPQSCDLEELRTTLETPANGEIGHSDDQIERMSKALGHLKGVRDIDEYSRQKILEILRTAAQIKRYFPENRKTIQRIHDILCRLRSILLPSKLWRVERDFRDRRDENVITRDEVMMEMSVQEVKAWMYDYGKYYKQEEIDEARELFTELGSLAVIDEQHKEEYFILRGVADMITECVSYAEVRRGKEPYSLPVIAYNTKMQAHTHGDPSYEAIDYAFLGKGIIPKLGAEFQIVNLPEFDRPLIDIASELARKFEAKPKLEKSVEDRLSEFERKFRALVVSLI